MTTFVLLSKISLEGAKHMRSLAQMDQEFQKKLEEKFPEVERIASYALLGAYDFLHVFEAPDAKVAAKYKTLSENQVRTLVVDDKWLAALAAGVQIELDRVSQALTGRIQELAGCYATPLPQLSEEVEAWSAKVDTHLEQMGFVWN